MVGPFARSQHIGMLRVKAEVQTPVLQAETPAAGDDARAKTGIIAVNHRTGVAIPIHHTEIYRIAGIRRGCRAAGPGWPGPG